MFVSTVEKCHAAFESYGIVTHNPHTHCEEQVNLMKRNKIMLHANIYSFDPNEMICLNVFANNSICEKKIHCETEWGKMKIALLSHLQDNK